MEKKTMERRKFLLSSAALTAAAVVARAEGDGGLAPVVAKTAIKRDVPVVPAGAVSVKNFYERCTGCQLCVNSCPNGVLRASTDLAHLLQPQMGFEKGWCRPECHTCSDVCPSGAISALPVGAKLGVSVGVARTNRRLCLANKGVQCGNCARHCPTGALRMVDNLPVVNEELCIGCGACEYLCPSRPESAITVQGREVHKNV